ncbi:MAG: MotA/TolQ/ExbB proton channel family protein, partial [Verrucomicrobiae bacterium]|nr:MotA/TolQ/ExbB proton channel family protein [Verrucomicrobiae bacterium]
MLADALPILPLADVLYSFSQAHLPGKIVIGILIIFSIFAWTIMFTKFGQVARTKRTSRQFVEAFRAERGALDLFNQRVRVEGCSLYEIYVAGCKEVTDCLRGVNHDGPGNLQSGNPLGVSPLGLRPMAPLSVSETLTLKQMDHIRAVLERTVAEQSLKLEEGLVMLATAVSGGPFLGLLGTVWG